MSASDKPAGEPWWSEYKGFAFPLLVIAAGFASHGIFTVVNFRQGLTFGTDQWSSVVFGSLCLAVDLIGVGMCTALSGRLRANGNWWPARKMMGVVYMSAAFSLLMFYGYNAAERIEPTKQDVAANVAAGAAQERSEKATAKARMGHIEFLQKQAVKAGERARNTDLSRRDRKEALARKGRGGPDRQGSGRNGRGARLAYWLESRLGAGGLGNLCCGTPHADHHHHDPLRVPDSTQANGD